MFARDLAIPGGLVPSPLATRPGGAGMRARSRSAAQRCLCNAAEGSSPAEREEAPVFSQHIVPSSSSMPLLPVPALLGAGRHFGNSLLLALSSRPLSFSPLFAVAIKSIVNLSPTFQSCRVRPPPPMFSFYSSQHCITSSVQSSAIYWDHHRGGCLIGKPRHIQLPGTAR